jgi:hypothetical protein
LLVAALGHNLTPPGRKFKTNEIFAMDDL